MRVAYVFYLAAGLAWAAVSSAAEPAAPAPSKAKAEQTVCFAEKVTGSHLRRRICMTEAEREQRRKADQEAIRKTGRSTAAAGAARGRD